jgi:hypothetical protein
MNYDMALIAHVIEKKNLQDAIQLGLTSDMLREDARVYWEFLHGHYTKFHEIPSLRYFQDHFPGYDHDPTGDNIDAIVYNIKSLLLAHELDDTARQVAELALQDPWEAKRQLMARVSEIAARHQEEDTDLLAGDNLEEIMGLIEKVKETGGLLGHPWPWDLFNRHTPGICGGHFIYIYGPEKSKKSWLLTFLIDFLEDLGLRISVHNREMSNQEFSLRLYCMRAQLDYERCITQGLITPKEQRRLRQVIQGFKDRGRILFTNVEEGIAGVQAKMEQHRPHIIVHDYMKALADDAMVGKKAQPGKDWAFVAKAADHLAAYSKQRDIPIIAVGHTNAEAAKYQGRGTDDAAHSKHIARRLDYMFRVVNDEYHNRLALILVAGRHARKFLAVTISGSICNGFGQMLEENAEWVKDFDILKQGEDEAKKNKPEVKGTGQKSTVISAAAFATHARRA